MIDPEAGQLQDLAVPGDEAHGHEQRHGHIRWPFGQMQCRAEGLEVRGLGMELCKQIELHKRGRQEVGGVKTVAEAVERRRIAGGQRRQHARSVTQHRRGAGHQFPS